MHTKVYAYVSRATAVTAELSSNYQDSRNVSDTVDEEIGQKNFCTWINNLHCLVSGAGSAWLLPLVNGAPPIGWEDAIKYLALPVLLVVAQFASSAIISPINKDDVSPALLLLALSVRS